MANVVMSWSMASRSMRQTLQGARLWTLLW
jgi:hypothetical protein